MIILMKIQNQNLLFIINIFYKCKLKQLFNINLQDNIKTTHNTSINHPRPIDSRLDDLNQK